MTIPEHYRKYYRILLRFSIIMFIVGLLMGILFQESAKKTPFSEALPPGFHIETIFNLAMVHGHTFLVGALIPLAVTWMTYLGLALDLRPLSPKAMKLGTWLYLPGATAAVLLMLYKGYYVQLGIRSQLAAQATALDFATLDEGFFFGSHLLRGLAYGLTHTAMALGLSVWVISFWKTMKPKPAES